MTTEDELVVEHCVILTGQVATYCAHRCLGEKTNAFRRDRSPIPAKRAFKLSFPGASEVHGPIGAASAEQAPDALVGPVGDPERVMFDALGDVVDGLRGAVAALGLMSGGDLGPPLAHRAAELNLPLRSS